MTWHAWVVLGLMSGASNSDVRSQAQDSKQLRLGEPVASLGTRLSGCG
jgi:hypothetical protein